MHFDPARALREATELTRAGKLVDATRSIQEALSRGDKENKAASTPGHQDETVSPPFLGVPYRESAGGGPLPSDLKQFSGKLGPRLKWSLGEVVKGLRQSRFRGPAANPMQGKMHRRPIVPEGAHFLTRSFTGHAGSRTCKLYLPAGRETAGLPLIVMLHGCTQNPDDFALGTRMNSLAEEFGFLVAYPAQPVTANPSSCWNWFEPEHQIRGRGEPAIIAGMTEETVAKYDLDRSRTFVAGLSAGGAMAAVMGATYPDTYSAFGVHSGLAHGSASDVISAFAAMRGEIGVNVRPLAPSIAGPRAIVFHGDADRTVHPANGTRIVGPSDLRPGDVTEVISGTVGGRSFTRKITRGPNGSNRNEHWLVAGAGHAWSGGSAEGSYTDAAGPDASREMVRFFLET